MNQTALNEYHDTCDFCGTPLDESGSCPVCDQGEEDY